MARAKIGNNSTESSNPSIENRTSMMRFVTRTESGIVVAAGSARRKGLYDEFSAWVDAMDMIKLSVPATLAYRDLVLRVVASACRLVRNLSSPMQDPSRESHEFDDKVVSAVGEAFNNVAIHAYRGRPAGTVQLELEVKQGRLTIRMLDSGVGFEPWAEKTPDLATLPESHMGLYIVRSFMDEVSYRRGDPPEIPHALTVTKYYATETKS